MWVLSSPNVHILIISFAIPVESSKTKCEMKVSGQLGLSDYY